MVAGLCLQLGLCAGYLLEAGPGNRQPGAFLDSASTRWLHLARLVPMVLGPAPADASERTWAKPSTASTCAHVLHEPSL